MSTAYTKQILFNSIYFTIYVCVYYNRLEKQPNQFLAKY